MGDGFRGVSADRDGRFKIAEKKLMAKMKFPPEFVHKVDMTKVHLEVFRPWVAKKVNGYLGMEDDVIVNMVSFIFFLSRIHILLQ
jgi:serine/arginine repetitive matrix protein 1